MDIIFYISACGGMAFQLAGLLVWGDKSFNVDHHKRP
jgi:hypothetical protein